MDIVLRPLQPSFLDPCNGLRWGGGGRGFSSPLTVLLVKAKSKREVRTTEVGPPPVATDGAEREPCTGECAGGPPEQGTGGRGGWETAEPPPEPPPKDLSPLFLKEVAHPPTSGRAAAIALVNGSRSSPCCWRSSEAIESSIIATSIARPSPWARQIAARVSAVPGSITPVKRVNASNDIAQTKIRFSSCGGLSLGCRTLLRCLHLEPKLRKP